MVLGNDFFMPNSEMEVKSFVLRVDLQLLALLYDL